MATNWMNTTQASQALDITPRQLRQLRKDGFFKIGQHYRIISRSQAARPTYQWHVNNCLKALNTPLEKR